MANFSIHAFFPMKFLLLFAIGFGCATATLLAAEEKAAPASHVTVNYVAPEKLTDFTSSGFGATSEKTPKSLTEFFTAHIDQLAKRYLTADERLGITVKDIDLAGRYEPERGPNFQNVRIYRDITFPPMTLSFRLLGPDGKVLIEG